MADPVKSTERIISAADEAIAKLDLPDRYVVEHEIARGGMGIVYAAHHKISGQKLAIKVLKEQVASDATNVKRFKLEATAIAKLNHPNIIRLIDFGVTDAGAAFMVTEFLDGASLKEKIEKGDGLSPDDFYSIMLQTCDALIAAHASGTIHRDIKPSNILLNADGTARVSDFGIARVLDPEGKDHTLTGTGEIIGSPQYMSPEQGTGQKCDARSDIYSVGCMMYEALTGEPPFTGANVVEVILNQINGELVPINQKRPERHFSAALTQIVQRCLQKEPDDRYADVKTLRADLELARKGADQFKSKYRRKRKPALKPLRLVWTAIAASAVLVALLFAAMTLRSSSTPLWFDFAKQAEAAAKRGDLKQEADLYEKSAQLAITEKADSEQIAGQYTWAARAAGALNQDERAASLIETGVPYSKDDRTKISWFGQAAYHRAQCKQWALAQKDLEQIIPVLRSRPEHKTTLARDLNDLANYLEKQRKYVEAEPIAKEAMSLLADPSSIEAAREYRIYSLALGYSLPTTEANVERAIQYIDKSQAIYRAHCASAALAETDEIKHHLQDKLRVVQSAKLFSTKQVQHNQ
jgi:serine/threonine protein kinase